MASCLTERKKFIGYVVRLSVKIVNYFSWNKLVVTNIATKNPPFGKTGLAERGVMSFITAMVKP